MTNPGCATRPDHVRPTARTISPTRGESVANVTGVKRAALDAKEREVGSRVSAQDPRDDLSVCGARADLFVGIEEMVGDHEGLRVDDRAARRTSAPSAKKHETRGRSGSRSGQIV